MSEEFLRIAIGELTTIRISTGTNRTMEIGVTELRSWLDSQVQNGDIDSHERDVLSGLARFLIEAKQLSRPVEFSIPVARDAE